MSTKNVIIIGDSISYYYTPIITEQLAPLGVVVDRVGGGDSPGVLSLLPEWMPGKTPDLIHFNCGLHDARYFQYSQAYQQPLNCYQVHLRGIVKWLKANTRAKLMWASITPVMTERMTLSYIRFTDDIPRYNAVARQIMEEAGIPINDLYATLMADSLTDCLSEDGGHMTDRGNRVLADAIVRSILAQLGMGE